MKEWKEVLLTDITTKIGDGLHGTPKYDNGGEYYFINGNNLVNGKIIIKEDTKRVNESEYLKHSKPINERTLLLGINGTIGNVAYYKNEQCMLGKSACYMNFNNEVDLKFIYYTLVSKDFQNYIEGIATGTTIPNVPLKGLREYSFNLPPLPEQTAIASVLNSLDDKIDLLHHQNATLEKMAETLFRQWFVEEAKEEWEIRKLGDIAEVQNGFAFSSRDYVEFQQGHFEVLKMGHIQKGGGLRPDPKKDYVPRTERLMRWVLNKGDIVMAMTDMKDNVVILGVPAMIDKSDNYVLNQRVARIYLKDKTKLLSNYLLYIQLKDSEFIQVLQSKANSGVQVNLSTETIKDCDIIIPPIELQKEKVSTIENLYFKVEENQSQIRTLTAFRDTLLPKLMSGEVKVEY